LRIFINIAILDYDYWVYFEQKQSTAFIAARVKTLIYILT